MGYYLSKTIDYILCDWINHIKMTHVRNVCYNIPIGCTEEKIGKNEDPWRNEWMIIGGETVKGT